MSSETKTVENYALADGNDVCFNLINGCKAPYYAMYVGNMDKQKSFTGPHIYAEIDKGFNMRRRLDVSVPEENDLKKINNDKLVEILRSLLEN